MIVVSDSSVLINLAWINQLDLLPQHFIGAFFAMQMKSWVCKKRSGRTAVSC